MAWYNTGSIALTNGSATVTGSGTNFLVGAQIGEALYAPDGKLYEIQTINSATVITLASNYLGSTATGQSYQIIPTQSLVADLASDVTDLISDFANVRDYAGNGKFNDGAVGTPGITFTQDQDNGLYRIGANNWALAAGGIKQVDLSATDVEINYAGVKKLSTTTSGIDVTGSVTADGLTVDTSSTGGFKVEDRGVEGAGVKVTAYQGTTNANVRHLDIDAYQVTVSTGAVTGTTVTDRLLIADNGDISFYEDTGTTPKFFWDASAERLGLGTTSPIGLAHLSQAGGADTMLVFENTSGTNPFQVGQGNDDSLRFYYNAGEVMRINASGNVGIGVVPESHYTGYVGIDFGKSGGLFSNASGTNLTGLSNNAYLNSNASAWVYKETDEASYYNQTAGTHRWSVASSGTAGTAITWSEAMRIDSAGNVGIGTSTPSQLLQLTSSGFAYARFNNSSYTGIDIGQHSNGSIFLNNRDNTSIIIQTNNTERMRIDASGNLLVATTSTATQNLTSGGGTVISALGGVASAYQSVSASDPVVSLNNTGVDSSIIAFRKDGTAVGNIASKDGDIAIGTGDTGFRFIDGSDAISPHNISTNAGRDAAIDLGTSGSRFKNLYLSGASLAGAGSATSPSISFSGDTNTGLYSGGADNISFATGGTARAFMSATQFNMTGNGVFSGSISKGSGSFKIDHPLPEKTDTHHLVHSFVESPQADNIYRGKVNLVDGSATVNIDDAAGMTEGTYVLLNTNTQCFTSNESGWTAVKGSVSGNILTITAQESCSDTISWMVIGERHDQHMLDTEWTDENGKVIVEPLKESQGDTP